MLKILSSKIDWNVEEMKSFFNSSQYIEIVETEK